MGLFFLLNLVLAIYYSNYKTRVENTLNKFINIRENFLLSKFEQYDETGKGYLNTNECSKMLAELFQNNIANARKTDMLKMAANLEKKCNGKITPSDFLNYFDFMEFVSFESRQDSKLKHISVRRTQ